MRKLYLVFVAFFAFASQVPGQQTFPHLLISPARLTEIQQAVTVSGSSHEQMLQILAADVDANHVDIIAGGNRRLPGRNYARGDLAQKAAMVYAVSGNTSYADIAFDALEAMYTDPLGGNVRPDGLNGKGLERANVGKAYAVSYDLAYNGWSQAQRDYVRGKIIASLNYWEGGGARFDNDARPYASNWNAVCLGSNLLQMLVLEQQSARSSHYDSIVARLTEHMSHYGDQGWTQEGNYYMAYAQQYLIPAIHALQRKGDTRMDAGLAEKGMYLIPMYGGIFDAVQQSTQWGVGGKDFGRQGWTSMIFSIVPQNMKGAYRYFYDRHRGILNEAPLADRYDPSSAGTVFAMMFYPESVAPVDPATLLPSGLFDDKGGYWFRSRWQDEDDVVVSLGTDTLTHDNAWNEADALQVNIFGFGARFSGGPGTSRDARFFSQITVDGQARSSASATGSAEFFSSDANGGYAIAGGGSKFGGLGVSSSRRHLFVSYPDADEIAIVSTFDKLRTVQLREYAWQLNEQNLPLFTGEEGGVPTFTLRAVEGAYLKGWVLHPLGGEFSKGNPLSYRVEGNEVDIWVVMAMGKGSAPEARINGTGLNTELTLGDRLVRWNAVTDRIESLSVSHPVPGFTMTPLSGTAPLASTFTPTFTGGNPQWDFGDGSSSFVDSPTHTFQEGGVYPIILTQDDGAGGRLRATHYLQVLNNAPLAILAATPDTGEPGLTVSFDASASSDPDGHPLSHTWDFGDGSAPVSGGFTINHTYTTQGTYFASVTVEDGHGGVGGASQRIEVGNQAPTAEFSHSSTFGIPSVLVSFDASGSSDPERDSLSYTWDFGDGGSGSGQSATHSFTAYGEYRVVLTVNDGQGNERSISRTLHIQNLPPRPIFTFSPNSGNAPITVSFDASPSNDPEGQSISYTWDFGDGTTGSGRSPSHTYTEAINTQVKVTVTDAQGASSTTLKPISILDASGLRAPEFPPESPGTLLPGVAFQLYNTAAWRRTMGDINTLTPITTGIVPNIDIRFRSQNDNFAHRFTGFILVPESGTYTFHVIARDNMNLSLGGLEVINTGTGKVFGGNFKDLSGSVGLTAGFHAYELQFHASDDLLQGWYPLMDFTWEGPGFASRQILPEELYWSPGAPSLDFLVSPDPGQMIVPETVNFIPDDPVGTQTFYTLQSGEPLTLNFEAGPSFASDGEIVSYLWSFGDGDGGAGRTVSQSYSEGTYVVTLTVQTDSGAQFTTGRTLQVLPPPTRIDYGRDASMRISANGQFLPTTGPENLFDGSTVSRWLVNESDGFVEVHFEQDGRRYGVAIDEFTLTNPNDWNDRDPKDVVFSGTLDGVNWTVIQTWENIDWLGQTTYAMPFPVNNRSAYSGYRWDIVPQAESPQGWYVELQMIQLFANGTGIQPEIRAPVASFSGPASVEKRQPLLLDAGASVSPDGYPLMYFWDFGDGQTARTITSTVTHRFFDEGPQQVRLHVRDTFGNLHAAPAQTVTVGANTNRDPVADFRISQQGDHYVFDATSSFDPDGDPLRYRWDFGNGIASVGQVTSHPFNSGVYSVTLVVEDGRGGRTTQSQVVDARPAQSQEVISINFTDPRQPDRRLQRYEYAGRVPTRFWNNLAEPISNQLLSDNQGNTYSMSVSSTGTRTFTNRTFPVDNGNARMLSAQWFGNGSSGSYTLSQIPYDLYDIYIYFGGVRGAPPRTQRITVNGQSKFIRDDTGGWNGVLEESTATSAATAVDGPAYVVFHGLNTSSLTVALSEMSDFGLAGIQIVNTSPRENPVVTQWPTASELIVSQRLSDVVLSGGLVEDATGAPVAGSFHFANPNTQPPLGTSNQPLLFVPTDTERFLEVNGSIPVTVQEIPATTYAVSYAANGGLGQVPEDPNEYLVFDSVQVLGSGSLTRQDFTFAGWRNTVTQVTYQPGDSFSMPVNNVVLVAQWSSPTAPVITNQPVSLVVAQAQPASFSVAASGLPAPAYQWRKGDVDIPGATSASYTIPSVLPADAGTYDVVVSNTFGSVTSIEITLVVTLPLLLEEMFNYGSANRASGYGDWQDGTNKVEYIGSSRGNGNFTHASYDTSDNTGGYLGIGEVVDLRGGQLSFTTAAPTGTFWISALVYKSSVTDNSITFLALHDSTGSYSISNPVGAGFGLSGDGTNLRPVYRATNGTLVEGPSDGYAIDTFHLVIAKVTVGSGNDSISLWVKKAANSFSATENSLGVPALTVNDANFGDALKHLWIGQQNNGSGRVDAVRISSLVGNDGLAQVLGQALAPPPVSAPTISVQPQSQTRYATQSATLTVSATGENLSYQWFKGVNELGGQIGASLAFDPVAESDTGDYHVVVSNPGGSVTSAEATLTVHPEDHSSNPANVPDLWAQSYYGLGGDIPLTVTKGGVQVSLRTVYIWGLDPTDPNQVFEVIDLQVNGSGMQLNVATTVPNRRYRLQYSDNLTDPDSWTILGEELNGNGGTLDFSDPAPSDRRFYRVQVRKP